MRAFVLIACGIWLTAIAAAAQRPPKARAHDAWTAPEGQRGKVNPLAAGPEIAAGGKKLFHQRCSACHGEDLAGTTKGPDLTGHRVRGQSDGALFWKISSGNTRTGMPSFSFLPEAQRWQLVMHIRSRAREESGELARR
jgi:mono/diheme cytochrome c family protein